MNGVVARCASAVLLAATVVATASAAGPAANGRILIADRGLYLVNPDGSDRRRLPIEGALAGPEFSPDGTRLAFLKSDGGPPRDLYVMNADGTGGDRLLASHPEAHHSGVGIFDLEWSPDGARIAYLLRHGPDPLRIVDARDGTPLSFRSDGRDKSSIDWSPDGSELLYSDGDEVYALALSTGAARRLTQDPGYDLLPAWSPDGSQIAWSRRSGDATGIWVANRDGSSARRAGVTPTGFPGAPVWSPDGTLVVYVAIHVESGITTYDVAVFAARADRQQQEELRRNVSLPSWSPDGRKILLGVVYHPGANPADAVRPGAYVMDADGSCLMRVADGVAVDWQPVAGAPSAPARCVDLVLTAKRTGPTGLRGVSYSLVVQNRGNEPAHDVRLVERFDSDVELFIGRSSQRRCSAAGSVLTCRADRLEPRQTLAIAVLARPRAAGTLIATVAVSANERDSDPVSNGAIVGARVYPCWIAGTDFPDTLTGTRDGEQICARAGGDVVHARGGDDVVDGGWHADRLVGGAGRDRLIGGRGNDTILARDGEPDTIECGWGLDRVFADRIDRVLRGCDKVHRR